jgi:hypothetical protein
VTWSTDAPAILAIDSTGTGVALATHTASYTPTSAGTDQVAITMNGTPISGSPFSSKVSG